MHNDELTTIFFAHLDEARRSEAQAIPDLTDRIARALLRATSGEGELTVETRALVTALGSHAGRAASIAEYLDEVRSAELYLASACARGDTRAITLLEKRYFGEIDRALSRIRNPHFSRDDALQALRERLLVEREGKAPRIGEFSGIGALRTWMRVTLTRILLNAAARKNEERPEDDALFDALPAGDADPELELLKRRYESAFRSAFAKAAASLEPRERTLLRHTFVDGLGIDPLAKVFGVHRATVARWIQKAREALLEGVRRELSTELSIQREELDSIVRLLDSRIELSLRRCFAVGDD